MAVTNSNGTPKSRALGSRLREARKAAELTVRELAAQLGISHSAISRWESGSRYPAPEDVASILTALGVSGQERVALLDMARGTDAPHWLSVQSGDRERQMAALLEFERSATDITDVAPLLIPGLLQTSDYARAIMAAGNVPQHEIETRVVVRIGRREVLTRRHPSTLLALIGEAALRQEIGGRTVVIEQLQHLLEYSALSNVTVQVVPANVGWTPALEGPFMLISSEDAPPIVHLENRRAALFFHEPDDVSAYQDAVERVKKSVMSPAESEKLIFDLIEEMETER